MNPSDDRGDNQVVSYIDIGKQALTVGGEIGCITVLIVLGAVLGGLWLDRQLGTEPLITVIFVLASAPFSLYLTYRLAKRVIEPKSSSKNSDGDLNRKKE